MIEGKKDKKREEKLVKIKATAAGKSGFFIVVSDVTKIIEYVSTEKKRTYVKQLASALSNEQINPHNNIQKFAQ